LEIEWFQAKVSELVSREGYAVDGGVGMLASEIGVVESKISAGLMMLKRVLGCWSLGL